LLVNEEFIRALHSGGKLAAKGPAGLLKKVVESISGRSPGMWLIIKDPEEQMFHLARCCSPIKGEPVVGYLTGGKGLTIHAQRCHLVQKEILDSQRLVDVAWDPAYPGQFKARLMIKAKDSPGVLARVATAVAELKGNISRAEVKTGSDGRALMSLEVAINDLAHLQEISKKILRLKDVYSVIRE